MMKLGIRSLGPLLGVVVVSALSGCQRMDPEEARVRDVLKPHFERAKRCGAELTAAVDKLMAVSKDSPQQLEAIRVAADAAAKERGCLAQLRSELSAELGKTNVSEATIDAVWKKWTEEASKSRR